VSRRGECLDITITSPPYNVGLPYQGYDDDRPYGVYLGEMEAVLKALYRATVKGGRLCLNVPCGIQKGEETRPIHLDLDRRTQEAGWQWMGTIIWQKGNRGTSCAWGSWASPSAPNLLYSHEFVMVYGKGGKKLTPSGIRPDITPEQFVRWVDSVWSISGEDPNGHPAPFPEELVYRLLLLYSYPKSLVCDPFCGSGTTGAVAVATGRDFVGWEVSEEYVRQSRERLSVKTRLPPVMAKLERWV
jgi:site-specific DNA-methyltransferase (adenine-specific)